MGGRAKNSSPPQSISHYRLLSAFHFGLGFLLLFFATYTVMKIHGEGNGTFPYYAGSFMTSVGVISISLVGVAIYDVGEHECEAELVSRVKPLIRAHFLLSLLVTVICIIGVILTALYGLCLPNKCSYSSKETFNYGMAAFLIGMQVLCLGTSVSGIVLFHRFQKQWRMHQKSQDRNFSSHSDFQDDM